MRTREFLSRLQDDKVVEAIRQAERHTSGEIRVFVSRRSIKDPLQAAGTVFVRLGMNQTRDRNGVLIFVAPRSHKFAVIGDAGVHEKCGDEFWQQLTQSMSAHFRRSEFARAILHGIEMSGKLLAEHFPRRPDDRNELPDDVVTD